MKEITEKIEQIIAEYTDTPTSEFADAETFADLAIDSLSVVEIVFDIEETFDIKIPHESELDEQGYSINSFNDVIKLVNALVAEKD